jgi:hypothetical protein
VSPVIHVIIAFNTIKAGGGAPPTWSLYAEAVGAVHAGEDPDEGVNVAIELERKDFAFGPGDEGRVSLDGVLWQLANALAEEGVVVTTEDLRGLVVLEPPAVWKPPK